MTAIIHVLSQNCVLRDSLTTKAAWQKEAH